MQTTKYCDSARDYTDDWFQVTDEYNSAVSLNVYHSRCFTEMHIHMYMYKAHSNVWHVRKSKQ